MAEDDETGTKKRSREDGGEEEAQEEDVPRAKTVKTEPQSAVEDVGPSSHDTAAAPVAAKAENGNGNNERHPSLTAADEDTRLPPGVPIGPEFAAPTATQTLQSAVPLSDYGGLPTTVAGLPTTHATPLPTQHVAPVAVDQNSILEEVGEVSTLYVGRVIGKGGEMIRDLQARSGCRIDVDQNVPVGAPRIITYRGTRKTIDFAKLLVQILCSDNGKEADLPLGEASRKHLVVPASVIGKIIGRGGEMIRELQTKSHAKIQVDHSGAGGIDPSMRQVTVTGTHESVIKAEEMVNFLMSNPAMDAMGAISMLMRDKMQGHSVWGSGPPYPHMPNNGHGMEGRDGYGGGGGGYGAYGQPTQPHQYGGYSSAGYVQQQPSQGYAGMLTGATETEIFPCAKMYMGRVIGQKGVTINDLQKRSGCDIQINQDVPPGHDCQITIKGSRQGIETAKQMLNEVIQMGPNHPYAGGGQGQANGGGGGHRKHGDYQLDQGEGYGGQQQQYQSYQQPTTQQPTATPQSYGQSAVYGHSAYSQPAVYGQQGYVPQYQQPQQYPYGAAAYGQTITAVPQPSPWKTASAPDGQTYYYNEKTGETSWEKPAGVP